MTAVHIVPALTAAPGVFVTSTVFLPGAAATRPASPGPASQPGGGLAVGDDERPAR